MIMLELWIMIRLTTPPQQEDVVISRGSQLEYNFEEGED
jgi:hypothetical protein